MTEDHIFAIIACILASSLPILILGAIAVEMMNAAACQ